MRWYSVVSLPIRDTSNGSGRKLRCYQRKRLSLMSLSPNLTLFLIGSGIGLGVAAIGGIAEYWVSLRGGDDERQRRLPGCLFYVIGGLAVAGVIGMVTSFLLGKGIMPALILGAGVLGGFYIGFILLFILWFLVNR